MTKTQYNQLKKLINKLEEQALNEGVDITSPGFQLLIKDLLRNKGFTLLEFDEAGKEPPKEPLELKGVAAIKGVKGDTVIGPRGPQGPQGKSIIGPQGIQGKPGKSIVGPQGLVGPSGSDADAIGLVENLKWQIEYDIEGIKKLIPKPKAWFEDLKKLEKDLQKYVDIASIPKGRVGKRPGAPDWGMPDKGSYGMAISDSRYYKKSEVDALIGAENLWDRSGTVLQPHTVGDDITTTGSIGATGTRILKGWFANLEITNTPTINGTSLSDIYAAIGQTMHIGTTAVTINRASAGLTLAGLTLTTPDIGTPIAGILTSCTGLPAAAVVEGSLASGMLASDHGVAATDQIINVCYGTNLPPDASTTTEGTLFIKYSE